MPLFKVKHITDTITQIDLDGRSITLVGTAHISRESLEEVKNKISDFDPDHVCVELDEIRLKNLDEGRKWSNTDIKKILRNRQGFMMMANLALASFQRRMGQATGVQPGQEMKAAVEACREKNIPYSCCDRSIQITLTRAWRLCSFWSKLKLISTLAASVFSKESASADEIEKLKNTDIMQGMMNELAQYLPHIKTVLIDERDHYLASKIFQAPGTRTLAVVGAAHVPGIIRLLESFLQRKISTDTAEIEIIPPKKWYGKALPWIIPTIIAGLFVTGIVRSGLDKIIEMSLIWILANGTMAALGAVIALAHPLTILISFIGAPITSLNPTIGVGMVAGLLEYLFRAPRVVDMENLNSDLMTLRSWYRNRITRILLVFFLSSLGSSVGTFIAIPLLSRLL